MVVPCTNHELEVRALTRIRKSTLYAYYVLIDTNQYCFLWAPRCVADWKEAGIVLVIELKAINDIVAIVVNVYSPASLATRWHHVVIQAALLLVFILEPTIAAKNKAENNSSSLFVVLETN